MIKSLLTQVALFILLFSGTVNAQKTYSLTHYTGENGLPQNSIKTLFADQEGFIWLGTEDGLVRFDGQRFYNFNRFNLDITNNRVIFGRAIDRKESHQASYYASFYNWETVRIQKGRAIRDSSFAVYHKKRSAPFFKRYPDLYLATGLPNFVSKNSPTEHYMVTTGNTDKDFYICDKNQITYYLDWKEKYVKKFPAKSLWNYFSIGKDLYYYDKSTNQVTSFAGETPVTSLVSGDLLKDPSYSAERSVSELYWNNVSDQVFLRSHKNLYITDKQENGKLYTRLLIENFDFAEFGIEKIYYDERSRKVFLGSPTEGLFVIQLSQFQVIDTKGDARDNVYYAQTPFSEHTILTSTGNEIGKNMATGKVTDRKLPFLNKLNPDDKSFIIRDKNQTLWFTSGEFLYHLDKSAEHLIGKWEFGALTDRLHEDISGKIWISSYTEGLFRIDPAEKEPKARLFIGTPFKEITAIKSESEKSLLIGTRTGLFRVETSSKKVTPIKGTETLQIKSIYVDQEKNVWFTAADHGLLLLGKNDQSFFFPMDKNRYLSSPHYIIDDKLGYFWIPTNKGLFRMAVSDLKNYAGTEIFDRGKTIAHSKEHARPTDLFYMYYAREDGFQTNEFNGGCDPCAVTMENGYISIPSLNGLVWFKPDQVKQYLPDGEIILDRVEVGQNIIPVTADVIRFRNNPENVRFYISTAYFGNTYNLNLSYALVKKGKAPVPRDWILINNQESDIRFSNLNSGEYELWIKKIDGFGADHQSIKKIGLSIPPLWYESWWAIVIYILLLAASIYIYNTFRLRNVVRQNEKLESLVMQRTSELKELMSRLEESQIEMSKKMYVLSRLLTSMTHDIQSPLNFVSIISSNVKPLLRDGRLPEVGRIGDMIADSSKRMSHLLRDLLNYIRVNVYGNRLVFEDIKLYDLVEEKLSMFRNMVEVNHTTFINRIPEVTKVNSDLQMVAIMVHNLIDNATKFTVNGTIEFYATALEDDRIDLVIANSAVGIPNHVIDMINAPVDDKKDDASSGNQGGLGLLIVKEVANLIGVSLSVTQTDVTRFHLVFD